MLYEEMISNLVSSLLGPRSLLSSVRLVKDPSVENKINLEDKTVMFFDIVKLREKTSYPRFLQQTLNVGHPGRRVLLAGRVQLKNRGRCFVPPIQNGKNFAQVFRRTPALEFHCFDRPLYCSDVGSSHVVGRGVLTLEARVPRTSSRTLRIVEGVLLLSIEEC